ncbi:MAG: hypothetical protein LBV17_09190 [Treponema sp.]|jgi:hypothetical protein|nr:hypothetical protein [Treponema sp.]
MKKIIVLGLVAIMLSLGLVLVSCGPSCPGGGNADAGECEYSTKAISQAKVCESTDCSVYKYGTSGDALQDIMTGKEVTKKCDC